MTTQFMRNYIDLINEMQQPQPQQLDEGVIDSLVGKFRQLKDRFMAVPGAAEAVKRAEPYRDQLEAIAKNSKSGKEAIAAINNLVAQTSKKDTAATPITEIVQGVTGVVSGLSGLGIQALGLIQAIYLAIGQPTIGSGWTMNDSFFSVALGAFMIYFGYLLLINDILTHKSEREKRERDKLQS